MKWSRIFRRKQWDAERSRELQSYLQMETDENIEPRTESSATRR